MIGDASDVFERLWRVMPRWFGRDHGATPVADALLTGPATALSDVHGLYTYAAQQTRIATATGGWLDLISRDFFGSDIARLPTQGDDSFRAVIDSELFRPKATRPAIVEVLTALTGQAPRVFEPGRAADTGAYDVGGCGYDVAGGWGLQDPQAQLFVEVARPRVPGVPNVSGYDKSAGGFDTASALEWNGSANQIEVTDAAIYAAIRRVKAAGVTVWVRIVAAFNDPEIVGGGTPYGDTALYSDGAQNYQPPTLI